jgi:hypothetical protein
VVAGHFTASVLEFTDPFWILALNQLSRYGTVLLAIASGYLTAYSFERKKPAFLKFFAGKCIYIYIPFLLSGVLYHYLLHGALPRTFVDFANILLGKTGGHLYFVFMICQYYLFSFLFRNVITKKNILYLIWLFMAIQYVYINYVHQGWFGLTTRHFLPTWIFTFYAGHLIYWYRGAIFTLLLKRRPFLILLAGVSAISAILFVLSSKIYVAVHLSFVLAAIITFLVMVVLLQKLTDFIRIQFRKGFTYFIYLFHSAFLIVMKNLLARFFGEVSWVFTNTWYSLMYLLAVYACTALASIILAEMYKRLESFIKHRGKAVDFLH